MKMGMKMAAFSTIPLLLLCCSAISSADSAEACNLYAKSGADFTVPMASMLDPTDTLKWMHNDKIIFHRKKDSVIIKNSVSENGSLKLTNVMMKDAGTYTPEVYASDGTNKVTKVQHLCVKDPAPKPTVTLVCEKPTDVTYVVLTCNVQPKQVKDLQFAWLQSNNVLKKENGRTLKKTIDQVKTDPISCKVSNLVSSMISEPVTHNCIDETPSFPPEIYGINTWILVGAGGGVVLVLIIIVIVCCICTKRRKRLRRKEEGELRLAWTNDKQQPPDQHHPHPHHPQQQPAGHTGPRQQRSRQQRDQQRPRDPNHTNPRPQASPRRPLQAPRPPGQIDEEQPPPLPQPRKNAAKTQRV